MKKRICLFALAFLAKLCLVHAGEEPYVNMLKGKDLVAGGSFTVTDEKIRSTTTSNFTLLSVDNILSFEIDFYAGKHFYNTDFTCTANVTIEAYNRFDTAQQLPGWPKTIDLVVSYSKNEGGRYKGMALYKFNGAHKFKVTLNSISSPELGSPVPEIFLLKGTTIVQDRKYPLLAPLPDARITYSREPGKLLLEWNPAHYPGAEMYDLEYTVIDKHSLIGERLNTVFNTAPGNPGPYNVPPDTLHQWFRNNNTRITLTAPAYTLNLTYDSGYVLFRLRGAQMTLPPDEMRLTAAWNYNAGEEGTAGTASAVVFTTGHEQGINWQYSATFAEEGKRKEVMSYFDGSFKSRQAVTINNSDNRSVVQESLYDNIGRPVVSLLPAPANDSSLHYFKSFNRNQSGVPFSFADVVYAKCGATVGALSNASGTAQYYSPQNPFTGFIHQPYIPDALGYPFAVTEYTPDNTGRIKRQGGVGPAFQLNSGHETSYFYGKPTQTELDRLFGTEAGDHTHYLKNMVVDPNGQVSVSYVNASGKTVATALAGKTPNNLHSLPSNNAGASVQVRNELIGSKSFSRNAADYTLSASATFMAPVTGVYAFDYKVDPQRLDVNHGTNGELTICNSCYYDLKITVKDDCDAVLQTKSIPAGFVFDTTCAAPDSITGNFSVDIAKIGEYHVWYELQVSKPALDYYDSAHIERNTDLKKLNHFVLEELKETDFSGCYSNCETCEEDLGEKEDFNEYFKTLYDRSDAVYGAADSIWVNELYDDLYAQCQALKNEGGCATGPCEERLDLLKADVTPGGQYALIDTTWQPFTNVDGEADSTAVYAFRDDGTNILLQYTSTEFTDADGNPVLVTNTEGNQVPVNQLTQDEFVKAWDERWAAALVKHHPEYCYYLWCLANPGSYAFDDRIRDLYDADSAARAGYFDSTRVDYTALLERDPFFNGGMGDLLKTRMADSLRLFSRTLLRYGVPDKNILQFIDVTLYCNTQYNGWQNCLPPDNDCRSSYQEWLLYRNLYLNLKQKFYEEARRTTTDPALTNCTNCYIGKDLLNLLPATCASEPVGKFAIVDYPAYACTTGECEIYPPVQIVHDNHRRTSLESYLLVKIYKNDGDSLIAPLYFPADSDTGILFKIGTGDTQYPILIDSARIMASVCSSNVLPFTDSTCNTACPGGTYTSSDRENTSLYIQYGQSGVLPGDIPEGYDNHQFYSVFDLASWELNCRFFNVWVATKNTCGTNTSDCLTTEDFAIGYSTQQCGGSSDYNFPAVAFTVDYISGTQLNRRVSVTAEYTYTAQNSYYSGWSETATGTFTVVFGPGGVTTHYSSCIPVEPCSAYGCNFDISGSRITGVLCIDTCVSNPDPVPNDTSVSYSSQCSDNPAAQVYKDKTRRYPDYVNTDAFISNTLASNPAAQSTTNQGAIVAECKTNCEAQADNWLAALSGCNADESKLAQLRTTFLEICAAGCEGSSGANGASAVPAGAATYASFEAAIEGILGAGALNDSCTAYLINTPYPHNKQPFQANRTVYSSSYDICSKLGGYKSKYQTAGFNGSFHQYLAELLPNDYTLDSTELDNLMKSCTGCNGVLKEPVLLPVAFEPGSPACLPCTDIQPMLTAFNSRFNMTPANPRYEALLTNYLNHSLGFSLTYADYAGFIEKCGGVEGGFAGTLCNQPVTPEVVDDSSPDENDCTASLFNTALENAYLAYNRYIDSVHLAFREAYTTKCLNVQAAVNMTADLYEYHYTLYYYDQSGNLVKTIPPEGVVLLSHAQIDSVQQYRKLNTNGCYQYGNYLKMNVTGTNATIGATLSGSNVLTSENKALTIEQWVKPANLADQALASFFNHHEYYTTYYEGISFSMRNQKLEVYLYSLTDQANPNHPEIKWLSVDLGSKWKLNQWNHVALTIQGSGYGSINVYLNGQKIKGAYLKDVPRELILPSSIGSIWGYNLGFSYTWDLSQPGWQPTKVTANNLGVKQFRLYNRVLAPSEIVQNALSDCLLPTSQLSLKSWVTLHEQTSRDLVDPSGGAISFGDVILGNDVSPIYPAHHLPTHYTYNSLNQVIAQTSPDGGESRFWYDRLGRLTASQNAEQKTPAGTQPAGRYSYTRYDALGRIIEVGEKENAPDITAIDAKDDAQLTGWLNNTAAANKQVTKTVYDNPVNFLQRPGNSRKRVVASVYLENSGDAEGDSTLYSYDLSGNVKTLLQHNKALVAADAQNGKKRIDYNYDLVSGKVNRVVYQPGRGDQFMYRYGYDAENRLVSSLSSRDGLVWAEDARYRYYLHGPLARTELGQYKVQGVDYAYTLQGWLKGMNGDALDSSREMGRDAYGNSLYSRVSKDAYAFKLGYFAGDYTPIGGAGAPALSQRTYQTPTTLQATGNELFNGNISYSTLALGKINGGATTGYSYGYDQLNRLREMRQHSTASTWSNSNILSAYSESIAYDANGNILKYLRKGAANQLDMDSLTYHYHRDEQGALISNRLNHVRDGVSDANYTIDIDNQSEGNYQYDSIGNLKKDVAEGINNIDWTVYGKIRGISKDSANIKYSYDPSGNRIVKEVINGSETTKTFYVRDAQGNVMGVYAQKNAEGIKWQEQHLYGSSRLGMWQWDTLVPAAAPVVQRDGAPVTDSLMQGSTVYELTNHLGNVLATISDKKIGVDMNSDGAVDYYLADVLSANDYYPFGMQMPGRSINSSSYRYGFNGKENDNEVKGTGNQQDYGMRIYDPRLGRFLSVDPLTRNYSSLTPYQYASNSPLWGVDLDGLELLKSNSSIYLMRYSGSYTLFNKTTDKFVVEEVYTNIPNILKDPSTNGLRQTMGGPVTAYGREWDVSKDGAYMTTPGRYYNYGPAFFGVADDAKNPSSTNSTRGLYSFTPDAPNDKATDANSSAQSRVASVGNVGKHVHGMVSNWLNQDIWEANAKEGGDRFSFYRATNLVDKYISGNLIGDRSLVNGQGRADLINFVTDGTLPMGSTPIDKLSKGDLERNLRVMYTGVQLLYRDKERGYINQETKDNFRNLNDAYQRQGGNINFSSLYNIERPE